MQKCLLCAYCSQIKAIKQSYNVSNLYGVKAVPQNFLLNPDGIIIDKNIDDEQIFSKLDKILPRVQSSMVKI